MTIRSPTTTDPPPADARDIHCTESGLFPALDALGGAAAIAAIGGGILIEHTSDTGKAEHFTRYYALPMLVVGVVYFYAASFGTSRVERCQQLKAAATEIHAVTPVNGNP